MKERIMKVFLSTLFLLGICMIEVQAAPTKEVLAQLPKSIISTPETASTGMQTTRRVNTFLPSLAEGNHEKWVDRVVLPEYAADFYKLLEEGSDYDGNNDFLIDMENSPVVEQIKIEEEISGTVQMVDAYGIKITRIQGQGTDYDSAVYYLNRDFDDKYYKIRTAQSAFDMDHSEVFWMARTTYLAVPEFDYTEGIDAATGTYTYTFSGDLYFILKSPTYDIRHKAYGTAALIEENIEKLNAKVEEVIASAGTTDDYELVKYFNYWLTMNNEHNSTTVDASKYDIAVMYLPELFECTSALFGSTGENGPECEAYARAFAVLCKKAGVPCTLAAGTAKTATHPDGQSSVWNLVQIDGKWYGVDTASNDAVSIENAGNPVSGKENEDYLVVGMKSYHIENGWYMSSIFSESHNAQNQLDTNGMMFLNGPVIEEERYVCTIETLSISSVEFQQTIILSALLKRGEYAYGAPVYTWYKVDEYGNETEIKGVTSSTYSFMNNLNGGTYTFRVRATWQGCTKSADISFYLPGFADVAKSDYYYNSVLWASDNGITAGISKNRFAPDMECTRGQMVTFLWRFYGSPEPESMEMKFEDVPEDAYYYKAVLWGSETGIVKGWTDKLFVPDSEITRSQLVTFLWRAAGEPEYIEPERFDGITDENAEEIIEFSDVYAYDWYYDAVYWAVKNNITKGYTPEIFAPEATATRAEIVTFLYRAKSLLLTL